jgi:hypothetical protein
MFKSLKQGLKKLIPGQSEAQYPAQNAIKQRATSANAGTRAQPTASSPDTYRDMDSVFK